MIERWSAFFAQFAAAILVVIGFVGVLYLTHGFSYQAGRCSTQDCERGSVLNPSRWFANSDTSAVNQATALADGAQHGDATLYLAAEGDEFRPQSDTDAYENELAAFGQSSSNNRLPERYRRPTTSSSSQRPSSSYGYRSLRCDRNSDASSADIARCWLRLGDAYKAIGEIDQAQQAWNEALAISGRESAGTSQAALEAHGRLQALMLRHSCQVSTESLQRIAFGFDQAYGEGELIDLEFRQRALSSLGYYSDTIDGQYGPQTRRAVRGFQRDLGFDQTGALSAEETVTLICHSALTARDADAQNLLGIMFATGLGVEQHIDSGLDWLQTAAERGHAGANYNLALIYGTGAVLGSYRLCGIVESPERADSFLRRAADLDHAGAQGLRQRLGRGGDRAQKWTVLSRQMIETAERENDRFYLAWRERIADAREELGGLNAEPGCDVDPAP